MIRLLLFGPLALVVLCAVACSLLFAIQRALLYHPSPAPAAGHTQVLDAGGTELRVEVWEQAGDEAVIYFGGNAEDVSRTADQMVNAFPGRAIFALHYPGYGGSPGAPSEASIVSAARRLFDWVRQHHAAVLLVGRSLGSGVAVQVASQRPVQALVLVTPFYSLAEVAQAQYRLFPVHWMLLDRYDSWRHAPRVGVPVLLVAAAQDTLVPVASTARLAAAFAPGVARMVTLSGVDHNSISVDPRYASILGLVLPSGRAAPVPKPTAHRP